MARGMTARERGALYGRDLRTYWRKQGVDIDRMVRIVPEAEHERIVAAPAYKAHTTVPRYVERETDDAYAARKDDANG